MNVVQQLYDPTFMPQKLDLAEFIEVQEADPAVQKKVQEHLAKSPLVKLLESGDVPKPLSFGEALAIDDEIQAVQEAIQITRKRIGSMLSAIDDLATDGTEISFKLDISKRHQLKEAIKKAFGAKTDTITYSMYKAAVEAKRKLEKQEADDYVSMKWKKDK
jgi:hypothetical protein